MHTIVVPFWPSVIIVTGIIAFVAGLAFGGFVLLRKIEKIIYELFKF